MKGFDAFAGVIKSGGKTRRAAKMVILNADHPDVHEFVWCKAKEEKKAWTLVDAGYDARLDGEAYASIFFQNSNNSVRVTDEFMRAVEDDREWTLRAVKDGRPMQTVRARDLWREIADAAWQCGDPGLQYDTTINRWHTCKATDRINASNPCSEYMFLDDTACNLASLNLMKFVSADGEFDVDSFRHAVDVTITAQEILVDNARYPTPEIEKNSYAFRPLGLGYANLGALLMSRGLPYDSESGRAMAAAITALMHGEAFAQSARIARRTGPFSGYAVNQVPMLEVLRMHRDAAYRIDEALAPTALLAAARRSYDDALSVGQVHGIRNSQVTVLAPTGTIAFMMDCDTTGIEPDIALVKFKKLVGGGMLKIVNHTVPRALGRLGYDASTVDDIVAHIEASGTIEGAPGLRTEHLPVFDCAFKPQNGERTIAPMGHVKMMAAVQPFLSGAISKTVNMPAEATIEDVERIYFEGWKLGLKAVAIYRDGCKRSQPLSTSAKADTKDAGRDSVPPAAAAEATARGLHRRRLSDERASVTHKFSIGGHEGYVTVGLYDEGTPGEIFVRMAKEGSTVSGLMDSFATMTSIALQYGVPLRILIDKFSHSRFEPSGWTQNPEIPIAKSITDYLFRWLSLKFLKEEAVSIEATDGTIDPPKLHAPSHAVSAGSNGNGNGNGNGHASATAHERSVFVSQADAPACHECGSIMVRSGSCYRCLNCAATSGCS
jgi:ribonucleoside-diphosphate reductase alpha chain